MLGCWVWGQTLTSWIYRLHYELFLGPIGTKIVGATGFIFLFLIGTGLFLWFPRSKRQWRTAFRFAAVKNRFRLHYDLHRLFGLYSSFALVTIAFSGVALSYPDLVRSAVEAFSNPTPRPSPKIEVLSSKPAFDEALALAKERYPDGEPVYVETPDEAGDPYQVGIKTPLDGDVKGILTELWIDTQNRKIIDVREFNKLSLGDRFMVIQFPIHNGDIFGIVGRWIVFVLGLLPSLLFVTGLILYLKKNQFWRRSA